MARPSRSQSRRARREQILAAAQSLLAEKGFRDATMLEVARRSRASKETLYTWFGSKQGLFEELVLSNATEINDTLLTSLQDDQAEPAPVLRRFVSELLRLLLGERALVINRAAISEAPRDPTLGRVLASKGREQTIPQLMRYLERQRSLERLAFDDPAVAVDALVGLAVSDLQVRRLLGVLPEMTDAEIATRADRVVRQFLHLFGAGAVGGERPPGVE